MQSVFTRSTLGCRLVGVELVGIAHNADAVERKALATQMDSNTISTSKLQLDELQLVADEPQELVASKRHTVNIAT